jgi:hypothetical protein
MKGRFLLRDLALSIPIFGDPVRLPDHNFGFLRITWDLRTCARSPVALLDHCRRKNFLAVILFQLPGPSLVADSRR